MKTIFSAAAMTAAAITFSTLLDVGSASAAQPRNGVYPQGGLQPRPQVTAPLPAGHFVIDGVEYRPAPPNGPHDVFHTVIPVRRVEELSLAAADQPKTMTATCAEMMRKMTAEDCKKMM